MGYLQILVDISKTKIPMNHQRLLKIKFSKKARHFCPPKYMKYICSSKKMIKNNLISKLFIWQTLFM